MTRVNFEKVEGATIRATMVSVYAAIRRYLVEQDDLQGAYLLAAKQALTRAQNMIDGTSEHHVSAHYRGREIERLSCTLEGIHEVCYWDDSVNNQPALAVISEVLRALQAAL